MLATSWTAPRLGSTLRVLWLAVHRFLDRTDSREEAMSHLEKLMNIKGNDGVPTNLKLDCHYGRLQEGDLARIATVEV